MRNPFASRRASLSRALTLAGAAAPLLFPAPARALTRVPYSLEETVQRSESIFVGRVVSRTPRWTDQAKGWMRTDVVLEVEDGISGARTGDSVTVSYWGGQIGNEAMGVSGVKIPLPNERFVMLLKPADEPSGISPVVGEVDGLFPVVNSAGGPVVTTADGANVALPAESGVAGGGQAMPPPGGKMPLSRFTSWLRANVTGLRARPVAPRPQGFLPQERVYPGQPAPETSITRAPAGAAVKPQGSPDEAAAPAPPAATPEVQPATPVSGVKGGGGVSLLYNFLGPAASLPITFNQLPPNLSPWAGVDQAMMVKWNYYADVFRVRGTPTGGFAWGNDRFDMCGLPSSETMRSVYGEPWGSNTLGICYWRSRNNVLIEADISLNPAYNWTLDDEWVFEGGSAWSFRNVMLHELGHAWGLDHNFRGISVMNYVLQEVGPLLSMPFMDDAEAIRRRYTGAVQNVADVGVYLFNLGSPNSSGDYPWWDEASFPFSARAGESFNASGFHVENVGTVEKNVVVEWYLYHRPELRQPLLPHADDRLRFVAAVLSLQSHHHVSHGAVRHPGGQLLPRDIRAERRRRRPVRLPARQQPRLHPPRAERKAASLQRLTDRPHPEAGRKRYRQGLAAWPVQRRARHTRRRAVYPGLSVGRDDPHRRHVRHVHADGANRLGAHHVHAHGGVWSERSHHGPHCAESHDGGRAQGAPRQRRARHPYLRRSRFPERGTRGQLGVCRGPPRRCSLDPQGERPRVVAAPRGAEARQRLRNLSRK